MALEPKSAAYIHLSEEAVEDYAFGRLPQTELAFFEEHLLVCVRCQEKLALEDDFAAAMSSLAEHRPAAGDADSLTTSPAPSFETNVGLSRSLVGRIREFFVGDRRSLRSFPVWGAGLAGFLSIGLGIAAWRLPQVLISSPTADAVTLKTFRGGATDSVARARSNRPLDLSVELAGMSSFSEAYRLEVVDATGSRVWTGPAISSVSGKITAWVEKRLAGGVYWVRLYSTSGKLLREFALRLE